MCVLFYHMILPIIYFSEDFLANVACPCNMSSALIVVIVTGECGSSAEEMCWTGSGCLKSGMGSSASGEENDVSPVLSSTVMETFNESLLV